MLYVFGDSFCHDIKYLSVSNQDREKYKVYPQFQPLNENWLGQVSKKLNGSVDHENRALAGCANEYIYHQLCRELPNIKEGDQVIVSLTNMDRRWLVEECPHQANWSSMAFDPDIPGSVSKEQNEAITQYARHLHSATGTFALYTGILHGLMFQAMQMREIGIKFLLLPGFAPLENCNGMLSDITDGEFDSLETRDKFYQKTNDNRWNHLSEANHTILANTVIDYFEDTNHDLDFTVGFEKNILTKENI